ncbi:Transmembrane protein 147 [Vitis vinifera]|uniref:BOS complex subunit TMEM147 n=1 Tax=Vitis vinifera TaxID=29760 RepID=A0A438K230_VITVI|nr:Transmembrane protein 147 [Vitis vinifera]
MTVFHFFNCAILTFGPHAVYYSATPLALGWRYVVLILLMTSSSLAYFLSLIVRDYLLFDDLFYRSEYDTLGTSVKAALVYLGTALIKLVCLATFLNVSENDSFDPYQELLKALIGFIDVAGLYFALTQLTHRNISQNHKFQAVGLGWAFADSVLHRLAPLWVGARGLEFTWDYILQGLEANANLVCSFHISDAFCDNISNSWLEGVEYIPCCIGIIDVASKKQTQDFDSYNIHLCRDCGDHAFYYQLPEARPGVAPSKGGGLRTVYLFGDGFH